VTWTLSHITDITMTAGNYALAVNYNGTVKSIAGATAAGTPTPMTWTQGSGSNGFQNPVHYYDVLNSTTGSLPPDGFVFAGDSLAVINAVNSKGSGPLPRAAIPNVNAYGYIDTNGDNYLSPSGALAIINYINDYPGGGHPLAVGNGDSGIPPANLQPTDATANVVLQTTDLSGSPITSIKAGQQFQLQAILVLSAPVGVQPFAGYADVSYPTLLVSPATDNADVGLAGSTTSSGLIDEAGRAMYGDPSGLMFSETFTATKKGTATFSADAADLFGHEIYVTGLNDALPISQVTFGSTALTIK